MRQINPAVDKGVLIAVTAILILALALRLQAFIGYVGLDDHEYAAVAFHILNGDFDFTAYNDAPVFPQRLGIILPTVFWFAVLGTSEWAILLHSLIISMAGVVLAYIAGSHFFGPRAGLIAALLWAIAPVDLNNATRLSPDMPMAFYASAGIMTVVMAWGSSADRNGTLFALGLLAGTFFGASWLCKESLA